VGDRSEGQGKDTSRNIETRGEFVVNLCDEALAFQMNGCAVDFPADWSEIETLNLATALGEAVGVPRLTEAPASLECRHHTSLRIGRNRIILGEVVGLWIRDEFVDAEKFYVATKEMNIIGRGGGAGGYFHLSDPFEMARQTFEQWQRANDGN